MPEGEDTDWLHVPDAQPIKVIPVDGPAEMDGFRIARPFDGVTEDRQPLVSPERGYITDPAERERLLGYLRGSARGTRSLVRGDDLLDPTRQFAVSATLHTDGAWIWQGEPEYYLRSHNVAPEPDFYRHIVAHGYRPPDHVPAEVVAAAERANTKAFEVYREHERAWLRDRGLLVEGDESRFPPAVSQELVRLGWHTGRRATNFVDPWLNRWADRMQNHYRMTELGYPPYEPLPPATAVLHEFGALASYDDGQGMTGKKIPFVVYPDDMFGPDEMFNPDLGDRKDDLSILIIEVGQLGRRLGKRLFQVGHLDDQAIGLLVAEDGKVYTAGDEEWFLGDTFDEALVMMLEGHQPRPIPAAPGRRAAPG